MSNVMLYSPENHDSNHKDVCPSRLKILELGTEWNVTNHDQMEAFATRLPQLETLRFFDDMRTHPIIFRIFMINILEKHMVFDSSQIIDGLTKRKPSLSSDLERSNNCVPLREVQVIEGNSTRQSTMKINRVVYIREWFLMRAKRCIRRSRCHLKPSCAAQSRP